MLMSASKEFITLCQAQLILVGEALRADSTAIYLADNWHDNPSLPDLVPIAAYPSSVVPSPGQQASGLDMPWALPESGVLTFPAKAKGSTSSTALQVSIASELDLPHSQQTWQSDSDEQLIIPLMHEGVVIGVLTSRRSGQPWQEPERHQWDRLAQTLTLACVLDQRGQWLETRLQHHRDTQEQQSQRFHELLHQIRSPLTALKTFGKLLLKRLDPEGNHTSLVKSMIREGDRIQDLLQYFDSALQATDHQLQASPKSLPLLLPPASETNANGLGKSEQSKKDLEFLAHFGGSLQIVDCDLSQVLMPILESAQVLANSQAFNFSVEVIQNHAVVKADPRAIVEIITTLLENAFKYANPKASIWVQIGLENSHANRHFYGILVGDTGPGIPLKDQPHIFERYYRGIQTGGKIAGTGIGLAIVQDLICTMDGYIELFSPLKCLPFTTPSKAPLKSTEPGTAFVVWLPTAQSNPNLDYS
jgi:signal transduction histidine kinase